MWDLGERTEASEGHRLLGQLKMIRFPFSKKKINKIKGGKGQMLCPRVSSGKRRTNERTGIKSCSEGELVSRKRVCATREECGKDVSLG